MKRIESIEDDMMSVVTYELPNGKLLRLDARMVRQIGLTAALQQYDLGVHGMTERLPVIQYGRQIGTMAPDFDPHNIKSTSFMYDPRPGDFKREGDTWVAARNLGASDPDCVVGFVREARTP